MGSYDLHGGLKEPVNRMIPEDKVEETLENAKKLKKIEIIPVENIIEVLERALDWKGKETILKKIKRGK